MKTLGIVIATALLVTSTFGERLILKWNDPEIRKRVVVSPRPIYPYVARVKKITGSGVVMVEVNSDGVVVNAWMHQSTGSEILDNAAVSGFKRWRFKPGRAFFFRNPITFTMSGAQY